MKYSIMNRCGSETKVAEVINFVVEDIHNDNVEAGWWTDLKTGESILQTRNIGELLIVVSEIAEGMEGARKDLMDDKLTTRKMLEVELADAVIRIFDIAGSRNFDLGGAIMEKRAFNKTRADHQLAARSGANGKKF